MKEYYDLTNPQKNIWDIEQYFTNTNINTVCTEVSFKQQVDIKIITEAIDMVIKNNDNFRLAFELVDDIPKQYFREDLNYTIENIKLKNTGELKDLETKCSRIIFDINSNANLFNVVTFQIDGGESGIIFTVHHLISDSWGMGLVCSQIVHNYIKITGQLRDEIKPSS